MKNAKFEDVTMAGDDRVDEKRLKMIQKSVKTLSNIKEQEVKSSIDAQVEKLKADPLTQVTAIKSQKITDRMNQRNKFYASLNTDVGRKLNKLKEM